MESFRTIFPSTTSNLKINHTDSVFCIGSCFATEVYKKLNWMGFRTQFSPFGISFNPLSIASQLKDIINCRSIQESELIQQDELWHSLRHHGKYSSENAKLAIHKMNEELVAAHHFLSSSRWMMITLGTSHYYFHQQRNEIAANCHKIPASQFIRKLGSPEEMLKELQQAFNLFYKFNPDINILLSVSPVRYLRDGFIENSRSKARLIELAHHVKELFPKSQYFPSYEIFMDDLRDYRFCKSDRTHPTEEAIEYILNHFSNTYFDERTKRIVESIRSIRLMEQHKPLHESSTTTIEWKLKIEQKKQQLFDTYPELQNLWNEVIH